uniref:Uncharacterized protein n=1 Tax=Arundo donax TaxID=35708 RepID=A0A0A9AQ33_ARUDO
MCKTGYAQNKKIISYEKCSEFWSIKIPVDLSQHLPHHHIIFFSF